MSFCSYEEAWGSPYESNSEHVTKPLDKENDIRQVKKMVIESRESRKATNDVAPAGKVEAPGLGAGMVETAPLRGSLLGGAIPDEQWTTSADPEHEHQNNMFSSLERKFDDKIDKLVDSIDKLTRGYKPAGHHSPGTSWADVLIFIALGIASIFILDMFFKFGKWMVHTKLEMNQPSQMYDAMPPSPPPSPPAPPSRFSYTPRHKMSPPPPIYGGGGNYHNPYRGGNYQYRM